MHKIVFRTDASIDIGSGHVMRCLTLATFLNKNGFDCQFICREHKGHFIKQIKMNGFKVSVLPRPSSAFLDELEYSAWLGVTQKEDAAESAKILKKISPLWLIVDHYGIDHEWESYVRPNCKKILSIDDLANRRHCCDALLDQTYGRKAKDYINLVPKGCDIFTGSEFALLRPEFNDYREASLKRRYKQPIKNILINLGGVDKDNNTLLILEVLENIDNLNDISFSVILGSSAPNIDSVRKACTHHRYNVDLLVNVKNIAEVMTNSDLAIGAAGATTWERCYLGLPTILLTLADNQKSISNILKQKKIALNISSTQSIKNELPKYINECIKDNELINSMTQASVNLVDGRGVKKIVSYMTKDKIRNEI